MKIIYLCALVFCINLGAVLLYDADIFPGIGVNVDTGQLNTVTSIADSTYGNLVKDNDGRTQIESDYLRGLSWFDKLKALMLPHYTLKALFNIPTEIAFLISTPIYIFYLIGLAQIIRNFSGEGAI